MNHGWIVHSWLGCTGTVNTKRDPNARHEGVRQVNKPSSNTKSKNQGKYERKATKGW